MIILSLLFAVSRPSAAALPPSVTFIEERGGPERLPHLQRLVDETDRGQCALFFEFLPRRANADASTKFKTLRRLFDSKTKFAWVFGMESEALKILEAVAALYIGVRDENHRDLGAHVALCDAIAEISFRGSLKKETSLQRWRKLVDLGHPNTVFERTGEMSKEEFADFLRAFYAVLLKHAKMDRATPLEIDLDQYPRSGEVRADVETYIAGALERRNAYMAESIVKCEKALARPVKIAVHPEHVERLVTEFRKEWSGLDVRVVKAAKSRGLNGAPP